MNIQRSIHTVINSRIFRNVPAKWQHSAEFSETLPPTGSAPQNFPKCSPETGTHQRTDFFLLPKLEHVGAHSEMFPPTGNTPAMEAVGQTTVKYQLKNICAYRIKQVLILNF
jgi:hypothetical protein